MNLCKLGLHNWEVLEYEDLPHLEEEVKREIEKGFGVDIISYGYKHYIKKVCLSCGKIIDTITPMMKKIKQKYYNKKNRQELAKKLI